MFFDPELGTMVFEKSALPYYRHLSLLYNQGWLAVDLFFVLSGFVFYWLYSMDISAKRIAPRQFAILRVSRLYPLHLLTFFMVVALQAVYIHSTNVIFVYKRNDLSFGLQTLLGIGSWLPNRPTAFNGPFWSVSLELLLYIVFFLVCRWLSSGWFPALVMVLLGTTLYRFHPDLERGVVGFFLGGLTFYSHRWLSTRPKTLPWLLGMGVLTLAGFGVALAIRRGSVIWWKDMLFDLVFAATIIFISHLERRMPSLFKHTSWLGDISFSVYLLHFPLQLTFVMVNRVLGGSSDVFYHPLSLLLFMTVLIPLGFLSYHRYEIPAQRFLRLRLNGLSS
jgi:peptidoglycan/LPS O-acetylase OafA/YrhL